jgi:CRP-like cAMP-binding protein
MGTPILSQIIPFRYLSTDLRKTLEAELTELCFKAGERLIEQGNDRNHRVFILVEGEVEIVEHRSGSAEVIGHITPGHYFGERSVLFGEPRRVEVRAAGQVEALSLPGERFLSLIETSKTFAQALGKILRDKQGIFVAFDRFRAELVSDVTKGSIDIKRLLPIYKALTPALHAHADDPETIDFAALTYAVMRLPDNVTRTFTYFLTEMLPHHYSDPDSSFLEVRTRARRRAIYEMLPGKNMVLIRDGLSDLFDFITCMCVYAIEARKIRRRMRDPVLLQNLALEGFDDLPFSDAELAGMRAIWGNDLLARLREICLHHEDLRIEIFKDLHNYNSAHSETWSHQLAEATAGLMGCDPADLPPEVDVHIISSNTHSVINCLSGWLAQNTKQILDWAAQTSHELLAEDWPNKSDLVYALSRDYFRAHPEKKSEKRSADEREGIVRLKETAFTGIKVQLIDTQILAQHPLDPGIEAPKAARRGLIVNIDYAFGQQAGHIVANLLALFGPRIRSVNVLGKAGGLTGRRGDIMAPTAFFDQSADRYHPLPGKSAGVDLSRLRESVPDRDVHAGTVLTVAGTMLQNRVMLGYNRHLWDCVGLEMEGSYFFAQIQESMQRGVVPEDLRLRFLYYTSDLPLDHDSNLSRGMRASEGVPALYAVTREILTGIFEQA